MANRSDIKASGKGRGPISRRQFIAGAGAATLSFSVMKPELVSGTQANSTITLGMIGCGGRGTNRGWEPRFRRG